MLKLKIHVFLYFIKMLLVFSLVFPVSFPSFFFQINYVITTGKLLLLSYLHELTGFLCPFLWRCATFPKPVPHGTDLSFYTIDYLFSASFSLYGIQLCYFSLIYSFNLPAQLPLHSALLFYFLFLSNTDICMNVKSALNHFFLKFSSLICTYL